MPGFYSDSSDSDDSELSNYAQMLAFINNGTFTYDSVMAKLTELSLTKLELLKLLSNCEIGDYSDGISGRVFDHIRELIDNDHALIVYLSNSEHRQWLYTVLSYRYNVTLSMIIDAHTRFGESASGWLFNIRTGGHCECDKSLC